MQFIILYVNMRTLEEINKERKELSDKLLRLYEEESQIRLKGKEELMRAEDCYFASIDFSNSTFVFFHVTRVDFKSYYERYNGESIVLGFSGIEDTYTNIDICTTDYDNEPSIEEFDEISKEKWFKIKELIADYLTEKRDAQEVYNFICTIVHEKD